MQQAFKKSIIQFYVFILCLLAVTVTFAQPVQVGVNVTPPYSSLAKDYLQQGNNVMITLINTSGRSQNIRLVGSLTGINNNIKVAIREDFVPSAPIILSGGQTRLITLNQLKAYNSNIGGDDIITQGIDKNVYLNGGNLPEGLYKLCIKAFLYNDPTGGNVGSEGCGTFNILSNDPPIILNPNNNASVKPLQPQFVSFSWTPSGVVGKTHYKLKLVDLTATGIFNPNDAFINGNVLPFFEQQNITSTSLQMDAGKPKLQVGNKYAMQVVAYDPQNKITYKNQGRSQVIVFTYKDQFAIVNNPPAANPQNDPPKGPCGASSKWTGTLKQTNKNGIANGTNINVGLFLMRNTVFSKTNGSYDGTGEILVNFVNIKVKVKFAGIQIGDDNRMIKGSITGMYDVNSGIDDAMANQKTGILEKLPNTATLMNKLDEGIRKVNTTDPNKIPVPLDLPLSFDKNDFNIGIVGMIFEPKEAYVNAVLNTQIPQVFGNEFILLAAKGIPIHPNGYAADATLKLVLAKDQLLTITHDKLQLEVKGGLDKTFATFDCSGFKSISINGAIVLPRTAALPYDGSNKLITDESIKVKIPFVLNSATSFESFVLSGLTFSHAFAIPEARDFIFKAEDAALDLSSSQKISGINNADQNIGNDWVGLYMKSLKLTLPEGFKLNGGRVTVGVANMFVNKQGIKGSFSVQGDPLVTGSIGGWSMSLTKVMLNINKNLLTSGGIDGSVVLPLGDNTRLGFSGIVSKGGQYGADVKLTVITQNELDANLFLAKIKLDKNSQLTLTKQANVYTAEALLNGEIGINITEKKDGSNVGKFNLPNIKFQELSIKGKENSAVPEFDVKFVELDSKNPLQAHIGSFELNLNDLQFKKPNSTTAGLYLDLGISLFGGDGQTKNGAGANTAFTIWAAHDGKTFKFSKATLDGIAINADLGVAKLKGSINIYDEDLIYGNGFRGEVDATLNGLGVQVKVGMQFGKTLESNGNYKYWYFDAMADFGKIGINIPGTAASIYGFGGGAWFNMNRTGGKDVIVPGSFIANKKGGAAPTSSGVTMTPQAGQVGFKAAVLFGITGSREAFNGDVTLSMQINKNTMGVTFVELNGNAYLMQDPTDIANRNSEKAFLHCEANIKYDGIANTLSGDFDALLNIADIVDGSGKISFKFTTPAKDENGDIKPNQSGLKWFIKVGQWTEKTDPFKDMARLRASIGFDAKVLKAEVVFQGYFMVGNDLPSGLPPLPDAIYAATKSMGAPIKTGLPASVSNTQSLAFAFGAGIQLTASLGNDVFGASASAAAGFDVLLSDLNATCGGKSMGIGGWYAQGQAYAYVDGSIKAFGGEIASFMAGAVLQIKLPNPTWVRGDVYFHVNILSIEGNYTRTIERGKLCAGMQYDLDPFTTSKLIKSVSPGPNTSNVNPIGAEMQVNFTYADGGSAPIKIYNAFTEEYEIYYAQNQVKLLDKNKKEVSKVKITGVGNYPYKSYKIETQATLDANAVYYVYAKSSIYLEKEEELYSKFTTGNRPAKFGMNDLYDSYPLPSQRYFMKQNPDGAPARGYLAMKQDLSYLFEDGGVYVLIVDAAQHLVSAEMVKGYTSNEYSQTSSSISFKIPENLKNNAIYHIQVLAPSKNPNDAFGEILFEGFHFKTSKFNNFTEKLNSFKVAKVGYIPYTSNMEFNAGFGTLQNKNAYHVPAVMISGGEGFDGYEMFGFYQAMGDDKEQFGRLIDVYPSNAHYTSDVSKKFTTFKTNNNAPIPELTPSQNAAMVNLHSQVAKQTTKPAGYPFEGTTSGYFSGTEIRWMENIKFYETILRQRGDLLASEIIAGAEGALTANEINGTHSGGGGIMNTGPGLNSGEPEKKKYYALMDFSPSLVAFDHTWLTWRWMNAAKNNNSIATTWNNINKMGFPKMPSWVNTITLSASVKNGNGKPAKRDFVYNYNPPK